MPKKNYDTESGVLTVEFEDETSLQTTLDEFPADIQRQLALHGLSQKVGDSYAGAKKAAEESDMTPLAYAKAQAQRVIEQLKAGDFTISGGGGGPRVTLLAEAISRAFTEAGKDYSIEEAVELVGGMDDEQKKKARALPEVKAAMNAIKAERLAKQAESAREAARDSEGSGLAALLG